MSIEFWNERYATDDYHFGTEPNAFLKTEAGRLGSGWKALCVADGEGRNGVFLAEQGLEVTAVEGSPVAIAKARRLAGARGVAMDLIEADLATWTWPTAAFDAVVAIFIQFADPALRARIFAGMEQALKPGGLLLLQGYRPEQLTYGTGGPKVLENLYTEEMLRGAFPSLRLLQLRSHDSVVKEGKGHDGMSALIELVAEKLT